MQYHPYGLLRCKVPPGMSDLHCQVDSAATDRKPRSASLLRDTVLAFGLIALASTWQSVHAADMPVRLASRPAPIYIEHARGTQQLNFELVATNSSAEPWHLVELEVSVFDGSGRLEVRKFVSDNGNSPSIDTLNHRRVGAGETVLIFNPFHTFDALVDLSRLTYRAQWAAEDGSRKAASSVTIEPVAYKPRVSLAPPLRGRVLVWDGHEFYSHHRRFDYGTAHAAATGTHSNSDRFGHDFIPVSDSGTMYTGDSSVNADWLGFGYPIYAAGPGRVVACADDAPDDRNVDAERFRANKLADYGNYIVVDHGGGEFALYGHLKQHSAAVALGQKVHRGQRLARIGASGSSLMPHLHFQLQNTPDVDGEGVPAYFDRFTRLLGSRHALVRDEPMDSGDFVLMGVPGVPKP